jgi:hypothetical protein
MLTAEFADLPRAAQRSAGPPQNLFQEGTPVPGRRLSITLTEDEYEWLRRKAHWEGHSIGDLLRAHLHGLIAEEGYLRPPDDDFQDFGYEKEMMQFVLGIQRERPGR